MGSNTLAERLAWIPHPLLNQGRGLQCPGSENSGQKKQVAFSEEDLQKKKNEMIFGKTNW